jgi:hypothetical protein
MQDTDTSKDLRMDLEQRNSDSSMDSEQLWI